VQGTAALPYLLISAHPAAPLPGSCVSPMPMAKPAPRQSLFHQHA